MSVLLVSIATVFTQIHDHSPELEIEVKRLIRQLDADERTSRVAAEKRLIEIGTRVLPLLPEIDASTPAEVKDRLTRIRRTLEESSAEATADASKITLQGTMRLSEFLEAVKSQTGNELVDTRTRFSQAAEDMEIKADFDNEPFFSALDVVLDQANMKVDNFGGEPRKMALVAKLPGDTSRTSMASYAGPFRVEPTEIFAQRSFRNPQNQSLRMRVEVLWEPRLLPIVIRQAYADITALGDNGVPIALTTEGVAEIPVQSTVAGIDLIVPLELPKRSVTKITSLKGTFHALVPGKVATFEFSKLKGARNVIQKKAGLTVTLDRVRKNQSLLEVRIKIRLNKASESLQSHLDWASNNVIYLEDKDGIKIDNPNYEQYLEREYEIGFLYLFPIERDIEEFKLVYKSPAAIIEMPVPYELKEIALP